MTKLTTDWKSNGTLYWKWDIPTNNIVARIFLIPYEPAVARYEIQIFPGTEWDHQTIVDALTCDINAAKKYVDDKLNELGYAVIPEKLKTLI
jgi:hypothetical protein